MTIHSSHPFADPRPDPARRLRGRLGGTVSLWTAGSGASRAGLTVTSLMVVNGDPPVLVAALDPDSELLDTVRVTRRCVVQVLSWRHRDLAEMFAGTAPAPGGRFAQAEFEQTDWGPRLVTATSRAHVTLDDERPLGWSVEVSCTLDDVELRDETEPALGHRRGRFVPWPSDGR